jgi:hypothetical protein
VSFHVAGLQLVLKRRIDALLRHFPVLFRSLGKVRVGFTLDQKPCLICAIDS